MSLLLDALKKAANEKHKNTQINRDHEKNRSLELELSSEVKQESSEKVKSDKPGQDEFQQVGEPEISPVITTELKYQDNDVTGVAEDIDSRSEIEGVVSESFPDKQLGRQPNRQTDKLVLQKDEFEKTERKENRNTESVQKGVESVSPYNNGLMELKETKEEPVVRNDTDKIKNEQILSELINKSNQHSRKKQIRKNISITILIILVITGAVLYFYIEMQAAKQGIYIADDKIDYKNQSKVDKSVPIVKDKKDIAIKSDTRINDDNLEQPSLGEPTVDKGVIGIRHEEKNRPPLNLPVLKNMIQHIKYCYRLILNSIVKIINVQKNYIKMF